MTREAYLAEIVLLAFSSLSDHGITHKLRAIVAQYLLWKLSGQSSFIQKLANCISCD